MGNLYEIFARRPPLHLEEEFIWSSPRGNATRGRLHTMDYEYKWLSTLDLQITHFFTRFLLQVILQRYVLLLVYSVSVLQYETNP
jgi:hypothetical protein